MKIKLSQYTPRKIEGTITIPKVSIHIKITLEEIYLVSDATRVMRNDTSPDNVLETKVALKRRRNTKEDIMLTLHRMMNLQKRVNEEDSSSDEEYVLISALTGIVTHGSNYWLIDSGASKHMTGFKESFVKLSKHESPQKVWDDSLLVLSTCIGQTTNNHLTMRYHKKLVGLTQQHAFFFWVEPTSL